MATRRVAVVTGGNKGIGFGIVKALCEKFDGDVFLTARDEGRGLDAVKQLENEGLSPKFHQLDVTDPASITRLRDFLEENYQGLDLLVNNAGICSETDYHRLLSDRKLFGSSSKDIKTDIAHDIYATQAAETVTVNYTSQIKVCEILFPILRPHARVCNISSNSATVALNRCSPEIKKRFTSPDLTLDALSELMEQFLQACREGDPCQKGFYNIGYSMSKIGFSLMSTLHQKQLDSQGAQDIVVNACSPGFVDTDMTHGNGTLSVEEGVVTPMYLCLLPPDITSPRGEFLRDLKVMDWTKDRAFNN